MLIAGIICEYNPFHLGHMALIEETRRQGATHIAAVMSGNFVQRGEPAILSKNARARQALLCGVDLVVELPIPWAMAGAEKFALGGVSLLEALGCEQISFGSECGDAQRIFQLAGLLQSPAFSPVLREELSTGATFARARETAVARIAGPETAALLSGANNTLGIEYAKAIRTLHSSMQLFTMERVGAAHDSHENVSISSASRIRSTIRDGENFSSYMPHAAAEILQAEMQAGRAPASLPRMERAILAKLRSMLLEDFAALPDISEGLENRIYQSVRRAGSMDELFDLIKTKRYPLARIRRIILSAFLGLTAMHAEGLPPYIRVLGMNRRGAEILHVSKMTTKRPIVANTSDILSLDNLAKNMIELECKSTDIYALFLPDPPPCGWDRTAGIIKE